MTVHSQAELRLRSSNMTFEEYFQELAVLLRRFADLQLEYAEICELKAREGFVARVAGS